ncbi:penicillin-binding protein 1C [Dongia sp. agr-C8]
MRLGGVHWRKWLAGVGGFGLALVLLAVLADRLCPPDLTRYLTRSTVVDDRKGVLLRAFTTADGTWRLPADPEAVDPLYLKMLLAYEDRRYETHFGVDPLALARALGQWIAQGRVVSGASTITMQTAKLLEPRPRTLGAKAIEMARALQLEARFSKREILATYLTLIPYGGNLEGVRAASLAYFGKEPTRLTEAEAALLVALPRDPEGLRPDRFPAAARAARNAVLERVAARGVIDAAALERARVAPVPSGRLPLPFLAPHLAEQLAAKTRGGEIATTLDAGLQEQLEALLRRSVAQFGGRVGTAAIVVHNPTLAVVAYAGGADYFDADRFGMIDMASATRSPGSTLKPFIYGLGFDRLVVHPDTLIDDAPRDFAGYIPRNFDDGYHGEVTVREALQHSLNVPAVAVLDRIGAGSFDAALRQAGVTLAFNRGQGPATLPLALGGVGIDLKELAMLYAAIPNGGMVRPLRVTPNAASSDGARFMDEAAAWYVARILEGVPPPPGYADADERQHAAIGYKTGTSYGYRDAWALGFTGDYTIGIWVGRPDGTPCSACVGIEAAAPILFGAVDLLPPSLDPPKTPPPEIIAGPTSALPEGLRRFDTPDPIAESSAALRNLHIAFPPDGSRVPLEDAAERILPLALRATGGRQPLTWMVNGRPLATSGRRGDADWIPDGAGFAEIEVTDALGARASAEVFLIPTEEPGRLDEE